MDPDQVFFESLSREERNLLALKKLLYDGSWDEIVADLEARKQGAPFLFKLGTRIEEDLSRIEKLRAYETERGVDLTTFLTTVEPPAR